MMAGRGVIVDAVWKRGSVNLDVCARQHNGPRYHVGNRNIPSLTVLPQHNRRF